MLIPIAVPLAKFIGTDGEYGAAEDISGVEPIVRSRQIRVV